MSDLLQLAKKWGTDKALYYAPFYDELLRDRRELVAKVLEFGIGDPQTMCASVARMGQKSYMSGASLYMWQDYFPHAQIYALDHNRDILVNRGRIRSFYCDQGDRDSYADVLPFLGRDFDLIVDDGSHIKKHQRLCFETLYPLLREGGLYVVEDCEMDTKPAELGINVFSNKYEIKDFLQNPLDPARIVVIRK